MKVKARNSISWDGGFVETGEVFDIRPEDRPLFGDMVEDVGKKPAPPAPEPANEVPEEPKAKPETKARTASRRRTSAK